MRFLHKYFNTALKNITSFVLVFVFLISSIVCSAEESIKADKIVALTTSADEAISYSEYLNIYEGASYPNKEIKLNADSALLEDGSKPEILKDYKGRIGNFIKLSETDTAVWNFTVEETGFYELLFSYYPFEGSGNIIKRDVLIDGGLPFAQSTNIAFSRVWGNESNEKKYDIIGNQILAEQKEYPSWQEQYAYDASGLCVGALKYYLTSGTHTLSLVGVIDTLVLNYIAFMPVTENKSYADVKKTYEENGYKPADTNNAIVVEGEDAIAKSEQCMYPLADRTSPTVSPSDASHILYNAIGGNQWATNGQWLEWEINVEKSGLYKISMHYKQALKTEQSSVRKLYIDGKVPFKEAESLLFPYCNTWSNITLSDENDNAYLFWLSKGVHKIRLEVTLGIYSDTMKNAKDYLTRLNKIYREIVVLTGTSPDVYRNYNFEKTIPETLSAMAEISTELKAFEEELTVLNSGTSKNAADIKRIYNQLDAMTDDFDTIPNRLSSFKDNISSFGNWINQKMGQPIVLDYISIDSADKNVREDKANFFDILRYYTVQFLASFLTDYNSIGNTGEKTEKSIKVWIQTGRDQAQILKQLINSDFTEKHHISVDLQLVPANSLLPAILTSKGPDVVLSLVQTEPLNLSLRNGLLDISKFSDFESVSSQFDDYAIQPFKFNGGVYALPETQTFPMLFYRSDILKELGISLEKLNTWDDLLGDVLPKLRKSSLYFGVMPTINNFMNLLYQMDGSLYSEAEDASALDSSNSIKAMEKFTMLYSQYGIPLSFDFANRFRSGEMPIAITDFTAYNQLSVFAPEINGLWGMLPIPGTVKSDGEIDHTAISTVTGCAILAQTKDMDSAWQLLKWWVSADVQDEFGKGIESLIGSAARYNSANKEAFSRTSWEPKVKAQLQNQRKSLQAFKEVPGGYFSTRMFNFAFRDIVYDSKELRVTMTEAAEGITAEINKKRKQYKLDKE